MKKLLYAVAIWASLLTPALAANVNIDALPAAGSAGGTDLLECEQAGTNRKCTAAQMAAYVYGLTSADATISGTGAVTFATVNANVGSFGSATACTAITVNAKGLITAASSATCTPAVGSITGMGTGVPAWLAAPSSANFAAAITDETGTGALVFGTSPTFSTGVTFGFITGSTQCLHVNTSGVLSGTGSDCGSGSGGVTNIAGNTGAFTLNATSGITNSTNDIVCTQGSSSQFGCLKVDNTTITAATGVISAAAPTATPSTQTGANYAFQSTDRAKVIYLSNGANQTPTIAQAGTGGFTAGWYTTACNIAAGTQTITTTTSTIAGIAGATGYVLPAGTVAAPVCIGLLSDGTNYVIVPDYTVNASLLTSGTVAAARGGAGTITGALKGNGSGVVSQAACADLSNGTALCSTTPGTGVATAAAVALSGAGGLTTTVASGTSALGTGAISSAACATVVTTTATNTATTDVISWGFNGDPTGVTGYTPVTTGALTIFAYPSANNVNFKVCNLTSASITPGAITLNWRVAR